LWRSKKPVVASEAKLKKPAIASKAKLKKPVIASEAKIKKLVVASEAKQSSSIGKYKSLCWIASSLRSSQRRAFWCAAVLTTGFLVRCCFNDGLFGAQLL